MRAYDGAETEYRTESGGFKKYFKDYGIFFIVSAVIFVAAFLCKTFVFSFENGLPDEDNYKHPNYIWTDHLDNESEIKEALFLGESFDNEIVQKIPLDFFVYGIEEVFTIFSLGNDSHLENVQTALQGALMIAVASPIYTGLIYEYITKKRRKKDRRFWEKATESVSLYFLDNAVLYFATVGTFFLMRSLTITEVMVLRMIVGIVIFILMLAILIPFLLSYFNTFLIVIPMPFVVTISNAANEAMEKGGIEDPTRGVILSVIAAVMVLLLVIIREKLNDLIVKLALLINNGICKLFGKIKGLFRRKT